MDTKTALIDVTARFMRRKGFYGTGLREIIREAGIPKGSLYHHFPMGKTALAKEAILHIGNIQQDRFSEALRGKTAEEGLGGIIEIIRTDLVESRYQNGCPIATVAVECSGENDELRLACHKIYAEWEAGLAKYFKKRNVQYPEMSAQTFFVMIEGALLMAKTKRDDSYFNLIYQQLNRIIRYDKPDAD